MAQTDLEQLYTRVDVSKKKCITDTIKFIKKQKEWAPSPPPAEVKSAKQEEYEKLQKHRSMSFTINKYSEDTPLNMFTYAQIKYCIFTFEFAPTTGTPHIQGFMQFDKQVLLSTLRNTIHANFSARESHGSVEDNIRYMVGGFPVKSKQNEIKPKNRKEMVFCWGTPPEQGKRNDQTQVIEAIQRGDDIDDIFVDNPEYCMKNPKGVQKMHEVQRRVRRISAVKKRFAGMKFLPWQDQLIEIMDGEISDRIVHYIYDPIGHAGKSKMTTYFSVHKKAFSVGPASVRDMAYSLISSGYDGGSSVMIDIARSKDVGTQEYSYKGIMQFCEQVLNGDITVSKYESQQWHGLPSHVFIFSNEPVQLYTEEGKLILSVDRLRYYTINVNMELQSISQSYVYEQHRMKEDMRIRQDMMDKLLKPEAIKPTISHQPISDADDEVTRRVHKRLVAEDLKKKKAH